MPTTANRGYRYPALTDFPNGPQAVESLAEDVDADVTALQQGRMVQRNATLSIPDSTPTGIASFNLGSIYSKGSVAYGSGIFTAGVTGLYLWNLVTNWPATTPAHVRQFWVLLNGSNDDRGRLAIPFDAAHGTVPMTAGGLIPLTAGDTVQAVVWQSTGGAVVITPEFFSLARIA